MIAGTACPQAAKPFLLACMIVGLWPAAAEAAGLADQLQGLATESGFAIEGLERLSDEPARRAEGSFKDRLQTLLQGYNYVLVESRPGNIERLVITGIARSGGRPPPSSTIPTLRVGAHHQVEALLVGPNGVPQTVSVLVDTGASTVVLPTSMITSLGFDAERLSAGISQTASGRVRTKTGVLPSVTVGPASAENVPVSFIADKRLNGAMLLGMSFLNRFRVTIDDEHNEIVLLAK
ncbi:MULTISPECIES: retropepsin-like aspartic protease family protein [Methylococcus]|jgi:aspartyl protease family protein|uniref:Aspartyl protease family protein n=1 Tax=Methylococcus capsulatus TaxID=414 RepID=A0AA35UJP3_METCP|nr:retropepsin-like aspartic protease [Methylococcus capsulatus]QXP89761.1 retroviral-like aspartic protease family protein [Methylococcus capsulatus]CAI8773896.1 aspartyl protease family protein [Methylococcus capsulatus]